MVKLSQGDTNQMVESEEKMESGWRTTRYNTTIRRKERNEEGKREGKREGKERARERETEGEKEGR